MQYTSVHNTSMYNTNMQNTNIENTDMQNAHHSLPNANTDMQRIAQLPTQRNAIQQKSLD